MDALSYRPDVILLDLGLPDMDGVTLIQKIRSWSNLPIIVISARSEDSDKVSALDAGADDYLAKPFSVEESWPGFGSPCGGSAMTPKKPTRRPTRLPETAR